MTYEWLVNLSFRLQQIYGEFGCVFLPFLQTVSILSNALILCLIAYDRYVCIVKMGAFIQAKPTWFLALLLSAVWIVSIGKFKHALPDKIKIRINSLAA